MALALILKTLYLGFFATVFASLEIEAEGKYGWAEKMPTWYRTTGFVARLYGVAMGGKPLTGYHSRMFFIPVMLFHLPFVFGVPWSLSAELMSWAMYFAWCVMWDYHWFILNPYYTVFFEKEFVWWHKDWYLHLFPKDYLYGFANSLLLAIAAGKVSGRERAIFSEYLFMIVGFGIYTFLLKFASPLYHRRYWKMRERDDRDKAGIFHHN